MIAKDNFKSVLKSIGFAKELEGGNYTMTYGDCQMRVDFENETLIYPEEKGLIVNDRTTSNFSHNENFVVFECVCRLLEKGYRPEHIELEPKWTIGHEGSGGKADIVVKDENKDALIIIECKTAGTEYNKEKKNTEADGGQLFSYWQQITSAQWLALYSSDFKDNAIVVKSDVIHAEDDANVVQLAKKDKNVLVYGNATNERERFATWSETYNKEWHNNLIFDEESQAYKIGIPPLRKSKLRDFSPDDKIVNRFEEILRHNNVSDKENAFNRLVALFICKLVDEIKKQDFEEVDFQYKQGADTYESLQDRLQRLHQQGMEEFMREKIFYVEADYAEKLFQQYTGSRRKAAIEDLKNTIRILKFYSNNDFAFKDVHNEELFFQNGKILVEVVHLFQPYRIVYPNKHQFLGDLFEQLLNKGFKQNEGQFFTPTPITRFIWDSLPLQTYISNNGVPKVIDYACGAGHFLTEAIEAINIVQQNKDNAWANRHVYGVEKDYRLARVSKVSMFMNGAGGANIVFGDGLENYPEKGIAPSEFDILVANPPYSVSGFKAHLKLKNNTFNLLNHVSNDGSEIETLFVERIAQLLKPKAIAAVILPASILSNASGSYTAAREELLKNFYLRAVVSFGSKTFGATGTNTVTLFLERYNEPPRIAELANDSVEAIMSGAEIDNFTDKEILNAYLTHQGVAKEEYTKFIQGEMGEDECHAHTYFKVYSDAFSRMTIQYPKRATDEEKQRIRKERFFSWALGVERDKLYYFALVLPQQTLVITAPSDNAEQKLFLGYDWSNRKGNEGIVINRPGGMLYNDSDRFAHGTLAAAVRGSFAGSVTTLPEPLSKYTKTYHLKDMMDFSREVYDKGIALSANNEYVIESKYSLHKLHSLLESVSSKTKIEKKNIAESGCIPVITQETTKLISGYTNTNDPITDTPLIVFGDHSCTFKYVDFPFICGADGTQLIKVSEDKVITKYLFYFLSQTKIKDADKYERHMKYLKNTLIPLPPIYIQQQIVDECAKIDEEYNTSRMAIETYRKKISDIFDRLDVVKSQYIVVKINELCNYSTSRIAYSEIAKNSYISTDNMLQNCEGVRVYEGEPNITTVTTFQKNDILLSNIRPYLKKIWIADNEGGCNPDVLILRVSNDNVMPEYLYQQLKRQQFFDYVMENVKGVKMPRGNKDHIMRYTITLPSLSEQQQIVSEIAKYEQQIENARSVMNCCDERRKAVLDKYLN